MYEGFQLSRLIGTLMLFNTHATHRFINGFLDELLSLLQNSILFKPNNLPKSHYEAKMLVQDLGFGYNPIHACNNGCVLYHNQHATINHCLVCGDA